MLRRQLDPSQKLATLTGAVHHQRQQVPSLTDADESPLSLLGVVSLEIRFRNTAYRAHFVIADRLAVNVLVGTRFLKAHLKTIDFERAVLVFKRCTVVPVLSSVTQDRYGTPYMTQCAPALRPRGRRREILLRMVTEPTLHARCDRCKYPR